MNIEETNQYTLQYRIYKYTAKINYFGVKRKFQKNGIGKKVIQDFIERCRELDIEKIKIDAYVESINFWKKMGFSINKEAQIIKGHKQDFHDGILKL